MFICMLHQIFILYGFSIKYICCQYYITLVEIQDCNALQKWTCLSWSNTSVCELIYCIQINNTSTSTEYSTWNYKLLFNRLILIYNSLNKNVSKMLSAKNKNTSESLRTLTVRAYKGVGIYKQSKYR